AILEHQFAGVGAAHAELVEFLRGGKSLHALFDDEGGHAARAGVEIGLGVATSVSATGPLVIHILLPFRTKRSPFLSARVFIETTSEPAPGSDIAKEPTCSPEISFGRYFRFCVSLPLRRIWLTQRLECAP